ncbi:SidA/IucD/PvdA family monooxygenase [Streptomyces sp. NPDC005794]|uniref:SidA/IucD/PvdA family monooxygenase n=1 Tax=Streptomyces sp. NPDC005794 TaxID=3364733 RepID=UPI003695E009
MAQVLPGDAPPVHDLVGIGSGPSEVAMATAPGEHRAGSCPHQPVTAHFFECQPGFGPHHGVLIDEVTGFLSLPERTGSTAG